MADSFHPYSQWLSLPVELTEPNHYQLLSLRDFESDEETIAIAADRAMAKVRGYRPGVHAKAWSQLLDELYGAKACLLDAASRAEYDRGLRGSPNSTSKPAATNPAAANPAKADRLPPVKINPDRYPPGMGPKQREATNDPGTDLTTSPCEATEAKQLSFTQPAPSRPTTQPELVPQATGATAAASSSPTAVVTPASAIGSPNLAVPVAYPVHPQMAGYAPHPGYAPPTGYAPPHGYPPGMMAGAGHAPMAMPYAAPPSPPPPAGGVPVGYAVARPYTGAVDPMAPVAIPGVTPAEGVSGPAGVGAVGGAIPVGTAVSMGPVSTNGTGAALETGPLGEVSGVGTSAKSLAMRNARRADQAKQNLMFIAGAAGIALLAAGGIYFGMSGGGSTSANSTTVAQNTQMDGSDAPAPMGRTLESELPGGTPRRVADRPTTPPSATGQGTVPITEQPIGTNSATPDSVPAIPNPLTPSTVEQLPEMTAPAEPSPPAIPAPSPAPATEVPTPETTSTPTAMAVPKPEPMSLPPASAPEKPKTASPQQLEALVEALTMGRTALTEQNFDEADKFIAQAAELAQADEHQKMVSRLREVGDYVKQFRAAVEAGAKSLETKDLQVGTSAFVSFVEVLPDRVIVRTAGQNRNYPYAELPPGLAQAIVDQQLDGSDPTSRVVKGAYYAVARGDRKTLLEKAQTWWEEAQLGGVDVSHLMPFLSDDYESLKSAATGNANAAGAAANESASE